MTPSPYMAPQQPFSGYQAPQPSYMATQHASSTSPQAMSAPNSGAVNLYFAAPVSNTSSGTSNTGSSSADMFSRGSSLANGQAPNGSLVDAYNRAAQSRNDYLAMANQINGQAYQNQNNPFMGNPMAAQQAQQQLAAQQYQQQLQAQQYQQQLQALQQQQMMQQQQQQMMQQQQPPMPPQGMAGPPDLQTMNAIIAQSPNPQEKLDIMNQIAMSGMGDNQTASLLMQQAADPGQGMPPELADQLRATALMGLGAMAQNPETFGQFSVSQLPGMDTVQGIIRNKQESPVVKAAAVQVLQAIKNGPPRPSTGKLDDKIINDLLKQAKKDKRPEVQSALAAAPAA